MGDPVRPHCSELCVGRTREDIFQRLLTFCHPDKVLVLHLRGYSKVHLSDVLNTGLQYVRKACSRDQRIHLHCFNGRHIGVENWLEKFPNCHIGFTAKVSPFNDPQTEARRTIPHYRILLETDSSYMPVSLHHGTNTSISGRYSPYRCSPQTSINGGLVCPHSGQRLDQ